MIESLNLGTSVVSVLCVYSLANLILFPQTISILVSIILIVIIIFFVFHILNKNKTQYPTQRLYESTPIFPYERFEDEDEDEGEYTLNTEPMERMTEPETVYKLDKQVYQGAIDDKEFSDFPSKGTADDMIMKHGEEMVKDEFRHINQTKARLAHVHAIHDHEMERSTAWWEND